MALALGTTGGDLVEAGRRFDLRDILVRWWPQSGAVSPIPLLDGLRGVAVLLVVVFHAWYKVPGNAASVGQNGYLYPLYYLKTGVQFFFVLSGFLLFLPYARWLFGQQSRPSTLLFYKRRALRAVPAYWINHCTPRLLSSFGAHYAALVAGSPTKRRRLLERLRVVMRRPL